MLLALCYGVLFVELELENIWVVLVIIGEDFLWVGVVAGLVGLLLVVVFIVGYYWILGLVVLTSLAIFGVLLWVIVVYLGTQLGLVFILVGVIGMIVVIGVFVDFNVVYFEYFKEDVRDGWIVWSLVDWVFFIVFVIIVKVNTVFFIGVGLLWVLIVGVVRGFVLYLGLVTLLDLVVIYFFMGSMV